MTATTMTVTTWKKLVHILFDAITAGLAAIAASCHYFTDDGRHAAPRRDDGQDVASWLRSIASPLRKRHVPPMAEATARVQAVNAVLGRPPINVARAQPGLPDAPAADLDHYLAEHAEQYKSGFDCDFPVLAGELAPLPWTGRQPGDLHLTAPMGCVPETDPGPLPPARIIADVGGNHQPCDDPWCDTCNPPRNVPGPAESAPAPPEGSAEAATPRAVTSAGPGTPPDDTVTDMAAVANRSFVDDVACRPLDWAAWLDLCLHGDLDTVKAVTL